MIHKKSEGNIFAFKAYSRNGNCARVSLKRRISISKKKSQFFLSMTLEERKDPKILGASCKKSGTKEVEQQSII